MSDIKEFSTVPDVSFIDNITLEQVRDEVVADYIEQYTAITGKAPEIHPGTPERLMLYVIANQSHHALQYVDTAAKMGLLKYSIGDFLDNLGNNRGLTRRPATHAATTLQFTLADIRPSATGFPGGTRVSNEIGQYFATDEYMEIPAGQQIGTVRATAQTAGETENGIIPGGLKKLVDPVPYVGEVTNLTTTSGGAAIESDDDFTLRIYNSPAGYSVAGPSEAYQYHAKNAVPNVGDIIAHSPEAAHVDIVFIMEDGSTPTPEQIAQVEEALSDEQIRPIADRVKAMAPTEQAYDIGMTYYISRSDADRAVSIQAAVVAAVEEFKSWQRKIGRDITPSKLIQLVMAAGAKRVEVTAPAFQPVSKYDIGKLGAEAVTYGGLEDD